MGKINLDKVSSFEPIRPERQSAAKSVHNAPVRPEKTDVSKSKDRINVSDRAAEVGKLVSKIKELPEVRSEKVEAARGKIEAGEFAPTATEIAEAILRDESE